MGLNTSQCDLKAFLFINETHIISMVGDTMIQVCLRRGLLTKVKCSLTIWHALHSYSQMFIYYIYTTIKHLVLWTTFWTLRRMGYNSRRSHYVPFPTAKNQNLRLQCAQALWNWIVNEGFDTSSYIIKKCFSTTAY